MRFLENEMSQDDTRLVGWLLWLAKHSFFVTKVPFQLNKSFKWKILCLICIFWAVILHHVSNCVILWHLEKQGCPDDFKFKFSIWDTGWALGSKQERFWNHLVTGIYIFRWPNNAVRDISKIFSDLNAWLYGDIGTHLSIQF